MYKQSMVIPSVCRCIILSVDDMLRGTADFNMINASITSESAQSKFSHYFLNDGTMDHNMMLLEYAYSFFNLLHLPDRNEINLRNPSITIRVTVESTAIDFPKYTLVIKYKEVFPIWVVKIEYCKGNFTLSQPFAFKPAKTLQYMQGAPMKLSSREGDSGIEATFFFVKVRSAEFEFIYLRLYLLSALRGVQRRRNRLRAPRFG